MTFRDRVREDPRPDLTSMVDIMFILLIFFVVTTTFATRGGIDVNLPQASSQRQLEKVEKLFVVINQEGTAFISGERMTDDALARRFQELAKTGKESLVIIEADQSTFHGRVVAVMDLAQTAGLRRLAIATEQKPSEPATPEATPTKPGNDSTTVREGGTATP